MLVRSSEDAKIHVLYGKYLKAYEEIIEKLDKLLDFDKKTMELLRKAAEKRIAVAPDIFDGDMWQCPDCGEEFEVFYDFYDYCPCCGKHIDRSELRRLTGGLQ